ncbi:MAG TPA: glycosyltransferase [Pseudomonadales bacterium]|nr:glycosyltransferase [Pseudomonadales bacterium]
METVQCSVLMCVYAGDGPDAVAASLASLSSQTRVPDEVIIVVDGPIPEALSAVLEAAIAASPGLFDLVRRATNDGLIVALNEGLGHCRGEFVMRMDADDVCRHDRVEKQLAFMAGHPDIDVLGAAMREFSASPAGATRIKPVKIFHDEIARQLPWRNPINHPTVCMRRRVIPPEGYPDLQFLEDYFLWARLLVAGAKFHNLPEPLLNYRFNDSTLARRSGWLNFTNEARLRVWMFRHGLMGGLTLVAVILLQLGLRFSPRGLQRRLWAATRR